MENSRSKKSRTSRSGAKPRRKTDSPTTTRSFEGRVAVKVTFVVFKGEINAIFRAVQDAESGKWTKDGPFVNQCDGHWRYNAYAHVGQHCEVDASLLKCRRATYEEYAPLLAEMRDIVGYDVEVMQHGKLKLREETGYAAVWFDDYDCDFGVYKIFRDRGAALDYLTDTVFERAKLLEVDVVDQSAKPIRDDVGDLVFPKMTWKQVRDQLGSGMDFSLVLKTSPMFDDLVVDEQASMGIREVTIS